MRGFEDWTRTTEFNPTGTLLGIKAAAPELRIQETSSIINASSIYGLVGFTNNAASSAAEWDVRGLTKTGRPRD